MLSERCKIWLYIRNEHHRRRSRGLCTHACVWVGVCVCEHQNAHCTSKMSTFWHVLSSSKACLALVFRGVLVDGGYSSVKHVRVALSSLPSAPCQLGEKGLRRGFRVGVRTGFGLRSGSGLTQQEGFYIQRSRTPVKRSSNQQRRRNGTKRGC